ncbi:ABC transporter permease [Aquibacillus koreensis]|uniref:ABC transporter permease n=1 Tax=Aquibacillus koreensis TaxID=279446 RepID=A0A9X4ALM5_9BACI|nr:ABC transporter permease [Aquibacillus koreensis]MCT2536680.1 ABC transporter permease [Aquibacillus koreensis]MDC3422633.1 ABC transporter permease [Aquibacillus koreensis]
MLAFLKKDVRVLLRDRTELLVLLLMPVILTGILGFALKGMFGENQVNLMMTVAVVNQSDAEVDEENFLQEIEKSPMPKEARKALQEAATSVEPYAMLEGVFEDEEVKEIIETKEMDLEEAKEALKEEEVSAIIVVPESFTYDVLNKMLLEQGDGSELEVIKSTHAPLSAGVFEDIISRFVDTVNLETAIAKATQTTVASRETVEPVNEMPIGSKITVTDQKPITSLEYYSIGMTAMFALFAASTIASKAYVETYQHVLDRILLSGKHPANYLSGKAISTTVIVFIQVVLLFTIARVVMQVFADRSWAFFGGMLVIALVFSICVGALASLLTALTVKSKSNAIPSMFSGGVVTLFALLGGSFMPVSNMPELFKTLGNWTPNGIMLNVLLQWAQGLGMDFITPMLGRLLLISVVLFGISILIFSKRRAA